MVAVRQNNVLLLWRAILNHMTQYYGVWLAWNWILFFVRRSHSRVYLQMLYDTMDFYEWKLNLTWTYKWIICKKISEHPCWSVDVKLTRHIKFCTCNDSRLVNPLCSCTGIAELGTNIVNYLTKSITEWVILNHIMS